MSSPSNGVDTQEGSSNPSSPSQKTNFNDIGVQPEGVRFRGPQRNSGPVVMPKGPPPMHGAGLPMPSGPPPPKANGPPPAHSGSSGSSVANKPSLPHPAGPPPAHGAPPAFSAPPAQLSGHGAPPAFSAPPAQLSGVPGGGPGFAGRPHFSPVSPPNGVRLSTFKGNPRLRSRSDTSPARRSSTSPGFVETPLSSPKSDKVDSFAGRDENSGSSQDGSSSRGRNNLQGRPWMKASATSQPGSPKAADLFNVPLGGSAAKEILERFWFGSGWFWKSWRYKNPNVEDYYTLFQASHPMVPTVMGICICPSVVAIPLTLIRFAEYEEVPIHLLNLIIGFAALVVAFVNWKLCWNLGGTKALRQSEANRKMHQVNSGDGVPPPEDQTLLGAKNGANNDGSVISYFSAKEAETISMAKINEKCGIAMMIVVVFYLWAAYMRGEAYRDVLQAKHGDAFPFLRIHKYYYVGSQHYFCTFIQLVPVLFIQIRMFIAIPLIILCPLALFLGRTRNAGDPAPAIYSFVLIQVALTFIVVLSVLTKEWFMRKRFEAWVSTRMSVFELRNRRIQIDRVIQNVLPPSAFADLVNHRPIVARREQATVSVAQVRDFLQWSCSVLPVAAVYMIDTLFSKFDSVVTVKYGAEKLKTTGDSYLAGWGVQDPNHAGAHDPTPLVKMAIWQSRFSNRLASMLEANQHLKVPFHLTIGVHTGPCVGGVFGSQRLWYDCAGEAFDVAQNLALQCPDEIGVLISSETRRCVAGGSKRNSPQASRPSASRGDSPGRVEDRDLITNPFGPDSFTIRPSSGSKEHDEQVNTVEHTIRRSLAAPVTATPAAVFALALGTHFGSTDGLANDSFAGGPTTMDHVDSLAHREAFLRICVSRQRAEFAHRTSSSNFGKGEEYRRLRIDDDDAIFDSQKRVGQLKEQFRLKDESNAAWHVMSFSAKTGLEEKYHRNQAAMNSFTLLLRTVAIEIVVGLIIMTVSLEQSATTGGTLMIVGAGCLAAVVYAASDVVAFMAGGTNQPLTGSGGGANTNRGPVVNPIYETVCSLAVAILVTMGAASMEDSAINSHCYIVYAALTPYIFWSIRRVSWKTGCFIFMIFTAITLCVVVATSDIWVLPALMIPSIMFAIIFATYLWEQDQRSYFQNVMMAAVVLGAAENELLLQRAALRTLIPDCVITPVSERCFKGNTNSIAHHLEEAVLVAIRAPPLPSFAEVEAHTADYMINSSGSPNLGLHSSWKKNTSQKSALSSGASGVQPPLDAMSVYLNDLVKKMERRAHLLENLVGPTSTKGHLELVNSIGDTILLGGPLHNPTKKKRKKNRHGRAQVVNEEAPQVDLPPQESRSSQPMDDTTGSTPLMSPNSPEAAGGGGDQQHRGGGGARRRSSSPRAQMNKDLTDPFGMRIHDPAPERGNNEAALRECCWDVVDLASALQQDGAQSQKRQWTVVTTVGPAFACIIGQHRPSFDILGSGARAVHGLLSAAPNGSCVMTRYFRSLLFDKDQPPSTQVRRSMFDPRRLGKSEKWRCRGVGVICVSALLKQQDVYARMDNSHDFFNASYDDDHLTVFS